MQLTGFNGHAHGAITEQRRGAGIEAVEKQPAGRRVRAVALGVAGEHGVQGADRQGIGTALGGAAHQRFEGQAVTIATVVGATQAVQLGTQAPAARRRCVEGIGNAVAACRCYGQGKVLPVDLHLVIADGQPGGKPGLSVQLQQLFAAILKLHPAIHRGREIAGQLKCQVLVDRQQRRQVAGIVGAEQGLDADFDRFSAACRVAKPCQNPLQRRVVDSLGTAIGVDPVHCQACQFGQLLQAWVSHGQAPLGWSASG
ncbi:hypothetical protein D3C79_735690 [compost metagenome]